MRTEIKRYLHGLGENQPLGLSDETCVVLDFPVSPNHEVHRLRAGTSGMDAATRLEVAGVLIPPAKVRDIPTDVGRVPRMWRKPVEENKKTTIQLAIQLENLKKHARWRKQREHR